MTNTTTFSEAENMLLTSGFLLGFEKNKIKEEGRIYKIFVQPYNNAIFTLLGDINDQILLSGVYFTWKPKGQSEYDAISMTADFAYFSDWTSLLDADKKLDLDAIGFPRSQSCYFEHSWNYYKLIQKYGIFLPWQANSHISFLYNGENCNFVFRFPDDEGSYTEDEMLQRLKFYLDEQKIQKTVEISNDRLRKIILELGISFANFGLK
jgi:hypothetical protein